MREPCVARRHEFLGDEKRLWSRRHWPTEPSGRTDFGEAGTVATEADCYGRPERKRWAGSARSDGKECVNGGGDHHRDGKQSDKWAGELRSPTPPPLDCDDVTHTGRHGEQPSRSDQPQAQEALGPRRDMLRRLRE